MNDYPLWKRILWRVLRSVVVIALGFAVNKFPGLKELALTIAGLFSATPLLQLLLDNWGSLAGFVAFVLLFWESLGKMARVRLATSAELTPHVTSRPGFKLLDFLTKLF